MSLTDFTPLYKKCVTNGFLYSQHSPSSIQAPCALVCHCKFSKAALSFLVRERLWFICFDIMSGTPTGLETFSLLILFKNVHNHDHKHVKNKITFKPQIGHMWKYKKINILSKKITKLPGKLIYMIYVIACGLGLILFVQFHISDLNQHLC